MQYVAKKPFALRLEEDLLARVKARASDLGQSQTVFVTRALEKALGQDPGSGDNAHAVGVASSSPVSSRASERTSGGAVVMAREALDETLFADALERRDAEVSNVQGPDPRETVTRHDHAGDEDYEREPFYE